MRARIRREPGNNSNCSWPTTSGNSNILDWIGKKIRLLNKERQDWHDRHLKPENREPREK